MDRGGNLYGPIGLFSTGGVFRISQKGSGWILNSLVALEPPVSRLVFGPDGALYGTTYYGGIGHCQEGGPCGTVFKLQPPPRTCPAVSCPWIETVLYQFTGGSDGGNPNSEVIFDRAGNLYGVTIHGGSTGCTLGCGVVYELTPSGNTWTESVISGFFGGAAGNYPSGGLVMDAAGDLFGVVSEGGLHNSGLLYELTPENGGWRQTNLYLFQSGNGSDPIGTLAMDSVGSLYGVTETGGSSGYGVVYELSQPQQFIWDYNVLYTFSLPNNSGGLTIDSLGELIGTTAEGGANGLGYLYKLAFSAGQWTQTHLHDFSTTDGYDANGNVIIDANGNIFGSSLSGGAYYDFCDFGCGTVWEFTP